MGGIVFEQRRLTVREAAVRRPARVKVDASIGGRRGRGGVCPDGHTPRDAGAGRRRPSVRVGGAPGAAAHAGRRPADAAVGPRGAAADAGWRRARALQRRAAAIGGLLPDSTKPTPSPGRHRAAGRHRPAGSRGTGAPGGRCRSAGTAGALEGAAATSGRPGGEQQRERRAESMPKIHGHDEEHRICQRLRALSASENRFIRGRRDLGVLVALIEMSRKRRSTTPARPSCWRISPCGPGRHRRATATGPERRIWNVRAWGAHRGSPATGLRRKQVEA